MIDRGSELSKLFAESVFKHRRIEPSPQDRRRFEKKVRQRLIDPVFLDGGSLFLRRNRAGKLIAAIVFTMGRKRANAVKLIVVSCPGDRSSLRWAEGVLEAQVSTLGSTCSGRIERWQQALLPWFERHNFNVRCIQIDGDVDLSLKHLRKRYGRSLREPFEQEGLSIIPAVKSSEVMAYLRILRSEYGRNPQYGPLVTQPGFLDQLGKDLIAEIRRRKKPLWLVWKDKTLIGGVDITLLSRGPDRKTRAGFGVNLDASAQGKKLARAIYETILLELQSRGIEQYTGFTAQPGVMRLGKIMGRKLVALEVDRGTARPFERKHFRTWI